MPDESMERRLEVVKDLALLFRFERMVYLFVSVAALAVLFTMAIMLVSKQGPSKDAIALFAPSGVITYSTSRLLRMWQDALDRIVPKEKK